MPSQMFNVVVDDNKKLSPVRSERRSRRVVHVFWSFLVSSISRRLLGSSNIVCYMDGGIFARRGIFPKFDLEAACAKLYENAVDRARLETGRLEFRDTYLVDARKSSPPALREMKSNLLRRCPALALGSHGRDVSTSTQWQPSFIITNRAWDSGIEVFDTTALHICVVAWRHLPSRILALDFYNNKVSRELELHHLLSGAGARFDEHQPGTHFGSSFEDAISRFQHEIDEYREEATANYQHCPGITLHLKTRTYRGCWVHRDGEEAEVDEDGAPLDAEDTDCLVLKEVFSHGKVLPHSLMKYGADPSHSSTPGSRQHTRHWFYDHPSRRSPHRVVRGLQAERRRHSRSDCGP
jgi:hypothetical protein